VAGWGATGGQAPIFRESHGISKQRDREKDSGNKTDKDRANICGSYLPLDNRTYETEVGLAGTGMYQPMGGVTDGQQAGEEQQNSEQTCERGIGHPIRANRFSSFLQALLINHDAVWCASLK
jgi:hypothetical protein